MKIQENIAPLIKKDANKFNTKNKYQDPLRSWPLKGFAYSNEIGAVVSEISPKVGTALWVPALMYFGADIYDKYKNEENNYNPSTKRGLKEAIFQTMASVILPTLAVAFGQKTISSLNRMTKTGLSTQAKEDVLTKSLSYMESKNLHKFSRNKKNYIEGFKEAISLMAKDSKGDLETLPLSKKVLLAINPLKNTDSIATANEKKLILFAENQATKVMDIHTSLIKNKKPEQLSKRLFKKFQKIQGEYQKIYPAEKYMEKAAKSILKDYHSSQIFKNRMVKTIGGFIALALLIKPIDEFVENIVIKKAVEPSFDYLEKEIKLQNQQKK